MVLERDRCHSRELDEGGPPAVRVLVAGDAAVGKTSLVEMICGGPGGGDGAAPEGAWTCGCSLSLCRESVDVDLRPVDVEVELWEVGGAPTYSRARPVFYDGLDAVLLVYDVSNVKSYHRLVAWLLELCSAAGPPSLRYWDAGGGSGGVPDVELEGGDGRALQQAILNGRCPVLFVANKCDLQPCGKPAKALLRPKPPDRPHLLDRLLGGEGYSGACRTAAEFQLVEKLCDLVVQGRHTEASSREDAQSFDFVLWRDFLRRTLEARKSSWRMSEGRARPSPDEI